MRFAAAVHRWALLIILSGGTGAGLLAQTSISSIEALIRSRDYDHALAATQSALRRSPQDHRLWTLEGIVLSLEGKTAKASKAFQMALHIAPDDPAALRGEAQILYQNGDKGAIPLLQRILKTNAGDGTAHEMLAMLEARLGNCPEAVDQFAQAGDALAPHARSLEEYGNCLMQIHQPEKAIAVFQQLTQLVPQQSYPQYDLAVALVESKRVEDALKVLEPMLSQSKPDPDVLSLASDAYEASGNTPKAVAVLRQAIVINPNNPSYYLAFSALCLNHESFQVGVDMLDIGIRHIAGDPSLYISRGLLYAQMAQFDKAEADFRTAEKLEPAQTISSFAIDLTDLQRNKSDVALADIRAQLKVHPESPLLNYLLAKLLWSEGNGSDSDASAEALHHALLAVRYKPDMTEAHDLLANIYSAAGHYDLAIEQCHLALQLDPADQTAIYHLIVALRHSGEHGDEIAALVKRLSALQQSSLQQETDRKRFSLVEEKTAAVH